MESDSSWLGLGLILISLFLLALTSLAHGALQALAKERSDLHEPLPPLPGSALWLSQRSERFDSSVLVAKTALIPIAPGIFFWLAVSNRLPWVTVILMGVAGLAFASLVQMIMEHLAIRSPHKSMDAVANYARALTILLTPVSAAVQLVSRQAITLAGIKQAPAADGEGTGWVGPASEGNGYSEQMGEQRMIRQVIKLEKTTAREIMVPRIDIVAVEDNAPLSQVVELAVERGYSRIPVYRETIDTIVGILYVKDLLRVPTNADPAPSVLELVRTPHFIPEAKKLSELLTDFRQRRVHIAIVVDEYGGTAGLVTIEDLLEEIVGEIEDEYDQQEVQIEQVSESEFIMDARVDVDQLNELFGLEIEKEDFETIGGFLYTHLDKIPSTGDEATIDGLTVSVLSTTGQRINKVKVTLLRQTSREVDI